MFLIKIIDSFLKRMKDRGIKILKLFPALYWRQEVFQETRDTTLKTLCDILDDYLVMTFYWL